MESERGFTLLEMMVAIAILSTIALATASTLGTRAPRVHPAQVMLAAALAEARGVALTNGDATDSAVATGATVTVEADPADRAGSLIRVYRSRPIRYTGPGTGRASAPAPLVADVGFPTARVTANFHLDDASDPRRSGDRPFTILISHSGYVSILAGYAYDSKRNNFWDAGDPGCADGRVTIAAFDGIRMETPGSLSCRDGSLSTRTPTDAP